MTELAPPPAGMVTWDPDAPKAVWPTPYLIFHLSDDVEAPADAPAWWTTWLELQRLPSAVLIVDALTRERADRLIAGMSPFGLALRLDLPEEQSRTALHDVVNLPAVMLSFLDGVSRPDVGDRVPRTVAVDDLGDIDAIEALGDRLMPGIDRLVRYGSVVGKDDAILREDDVALVHDDEGWWIRTTPALSVDDGPGVVTLEPVGHTEIVARLREMIPLERID